MARVQALLLILAAALTFVLGQDSEITRVRPLTEEEKRLSQPREKTRSIYLLNLVPLPRARQDEQGSNGVGNDLKDAPPVESPRDFNPTLFLLQKVDDSQNLPDGIYYRPAEDETETPKPSYVRDLTDLQSYILARGRFNSPGRQ